MNGDSPIGIFDSGLGGLTVAGRVMEKLPRESIAYLGDQIHLPYGERSVEEIRNFALGITEFLVRQHARMVIMACNMSTATALRAAREVFPDTPILGVIEAGARAAAGMHSGGPIGVIATRGTVSTRAYTDALLRVLPGVEVIEQACPRFVPLVEAGKCDCPEAEDAVSEYVEPLLSSGCRTLVLGCTHYPFLMETIRRTAGPGVAIVDPAEETAAEAARVLRETGALSLHCAEPVQAYYTTGCPAQFAELGGRFLGRTISDVQQLTWGVDLGAIEWQEKMVGQTTKSVP